MDFINSDPSLSSHDNWGNEFVDSCKIRTLLGHCNISYSDSFSYSTLENFDNNQINDLYSYIFYKDIQNYFDSKYALQVLQNDFSDLFYYINECITSINGGSKLGSIIILRSCIEVFLHALYPNKKGDKLSHTINYFVDKIQEDDRFVDFVKIDKHRELESFFNEIRELGNDAVHNRVQDVKTLLDKYNEKEILKLVLILAESSILKEGIEKMTRDSIVARSTNAKYSINKIEETKSASIDNEIPF